MLEYKVLTKGCEPQRMRKGDAGIDLRAAEDVVIRPGDSEVIPLGVAFKIPEGMYGMLTHRSSMAFGKNCTASLGVIDSNFTQEIKCKLFCHSDFYEARIKKGDRIAQLIIHKYQGLELEEAEELGESKGGFGSSDSLEKSSE